MSIDSSAALPVDTNSAAPSLAKAHRRLSSVDHLRGLVMVIMVLDHTRDFLMNSHIDPTNLATTYPLLFFTRWLTHLCPPTFVFLAGTSALLMHARGKSKPELAGFLFTRGLWLILLELTLVKFLWSFRLDYSFGILQVIWAIGGSMVILSGLVFLPVWLVGAIGVAIVAGHNLLDLLPPETMKSLGLASTLVRPGSIPMPRGMLIVAYPVIPWLGVMASGFAFGEILLAKHHRRRRAIFALGAALTLAFVALRVLNGYGDPSKWSWQSSWPMTVVSFLNLTKYPPSLLYLIMTLGPSLMLLAWFDGGTGLIGQRLVTFGRVPMFFYLLQWIYVHFPPMVLELARGKPIAWMLKDAPFDSPADYGYGLPTVYISWMVGVMLLYIPCRWFADFKRRRHYWWLSYV